MGIYYLNVEGRMINGITEVGYSVILLIASLKSVTDFVY